MDRRGLQLFKNQSSNNPRSGTHRQYDVKRRNVATGNVAGHSFVSSSRKKKTFKDEKD
jgi:hypothetical protein